jgi:hypothetical protein
MPYGGNDWLSLTQEPTLEPELPICDPHHHFWDRRLQSIPYQRSVAERSFSLCDRLEMLIKPMPQPILRKRW